MRTLFFLVLVAIVSAKNFDAVVDADVVVYGATPSGIVAAIAAAADKKTVALIERSKWIGGMMSGGLGHTDVGKASAIGGYASDFFRKVGSYYGMTLSYDFEPHVATKIFYEWISQYPTLTLYLSQELQDAKVQSKKILSISTRNASTALDFVGKVFIDATYEGDLLRASGVSYTWGRESNSQYDETLAGRQFAPSSFGGHQFTEPVNPYDDTGKLLPLVYGGDPGTVGQADKKVQAYNFRLSMSSDPNNQVPIPRPSNYDPTRWELFRRHIKASKGVSLATFMNLGSVPNKKVDVNNNGPISTDYIGGSWDYPTANWTQRQLIWNDHIQYTLEFFYFLQTDPSVPSGVKSELAKWGFSKDEFVDNGYFPTQLYVREALRMVGSYVFTQSDRGLHYTKTDSIGLGGYNIDAHNAQRIPQGNGTVNEGDTEITFYLGFQIPYGILTPKIEEMENFLVPVCVSSTHIGYGPLRLEPQFMIMGQAAGTAASLAIDQQVAVQNVNIPNLQSKLTSTGAVLSLLDWAFAKK